MDSLQDQEQCCAFSLSCIQDGIEMSMLSESLKKALAIRAVELAQREGPRPCAVKRTDEQIVGVPVLRLGKLPVQRRTEDQTVAVPALLVKEIVEVLLSPPREDTQQPIKKVSCATAHRSSSWIYPSFRSRRKWWR